MAKKQEPAPIGFRPTRPMPDEAGNTPPKPPVADDGGQDDGGEPDDADSFSDPNFEKLMAEIGRRFERANSLDEAGLKLTTGEVYERLQAFYPSTFYSPRLVYDALERLGFNYDDPFKDMNFVWLFK